MIWALAAAIGATVAAGVYLALSRDLLRSVIGISLFASAANLVVFAAGRPGPMTPALVLPGATTLAEGAANPLPQALVLTAVVIGFSLTCFSLVLVLALKQRAGVRDSHTLRFAEPGAGADGKPALEAPPAPAPARREGHAHHEQADAQPARDADEPARLRPDIAAPDPGEA